MDRSPGSTMVAMVLAAYACGGVDEPSFDPGLQIVSGAGQSDTVGVHLAPPLTVRLSDSAGKPLPGVEITFQSVNCTLEARPPCPVWVAPVGTELSGISFVSDTTDAGGEAAVQVELGLSALDVAIWIRSPATGDEVYARFTVLPGAPARIDVTPDDSALFGGGSYLLRARTMDAHGNTRTGDPVTYAVLDGPIAMTPQGTVTAQAVGRGRIIASTGSGADTAFVSVVPDGAISANHRDVQEDVRILRLDGSGTLLLGEGWSSTECGKPAWSPGGSELVFAVPDDGGVCTLQVFDLAGDSRALAPSDMAPEQEHPRFSRDGEWVYFSTAPPSGGGSISRVHPDGTGLEQVVSVAVPGSTEPDPSPDGQRLAYVQPLLDGSGDLLVRDLPTTTDHALGKGFLPRWSPDGEWIAYRSGGLESETGPIRLVRPDGTQDHQVSAAGRLYTSAGLDWSPDSQWLIARADDRLELIQIATALTLPLGYSRSLDWAAWQPVPQ